MAGNTSYKLGIVISADASSVKPATAETRNELTSIGNAAQATETKLQKLIASATGLHVGAANTNSREWLGALAAEGAALDNLRSKYNPMFAVISQYKTAQAEIRAAHAMGALSTDEMTAAIQRQRQAALASIDAIKGRNSALAGGGHNMAAVNSMYQFQDIGMTAAMGMNPAMIALQQGTQLSGGFAGMSLKQAGASLAGGFAMLMSPVSLATVALTGLTAAAIQYAMTWNNNAKDLNKTIEEHETRVKRMQEAYKYAGTAAEDFYRKANTGQRLLTQTSRDELEKSLRSETTSMIDRLGWAPTEGDASQFGLHAPNLWQVRSKYKEFEDAILHLRKTAEDGKPDIVGFREMIEKRWLLEPNNEALKKTGQSLVDLSADGAKAAEALMKFSPEAIKAQNAIDALQRKAEEYKKAMSSLLDTAALEKSPRLLALESHRLALVNATSREEKEDATDIYGRALARINDQEQRKLELAHLDIQMQVARDPLTRAELAAQRERITLSGMQIDATEAELRVRQARNQSMQESLAQSSAQLIDLKAEVDARRLVNDAVAKGTMNIADAHIYLQAETELRPLIIAAARAEGEEKQKLLTIINQMTLGYQQMAEEQKRANALELLQGQKDDATRLQLELSLVGATDLARRRALSTLQAEQELKRQGISTESELGTLYRRNAELMTEARITLERQTDAWSQYRSAGEDAIDGIFNALGSGNFKDSLKDIGLELTKTFTDLAVKNPFKNWLMGTNYGTIDDLFKPNSGSGLLSGILGGQSVGAMNVQAAVVNLNGAGIGGMGGLGGLTGNISRLLNPANMNGSATGYKIEDFAAATRLIESAGNGGYKALGPILANGDRAYGAYQVMGANIGPWTKSALGYSMSPDQFLGSSSAQDAVFNKVFGGYVDKFGANGAAQAWFGGPGSVGKGGVTDILGTSGTDYVNKFNDALGKVTSTAGSTSSSLTGFASNISGAGNGLNQLGSGFNQFGKQLSGFAMGGGGGFNIMSLFPGLGGFQSQQLAGAVASGSWGLWDSGGYTGAGGIYEPRGIVHAGEVVWSQRDVARAGGVDVVEGMRLGMRGYANGGPVARSAPTPISRFNNSAGSDAAQTSGKFGFGSLTVHQDLRGSSGEDVEEKAYLGMQRALQEFSDHALPDRVLEINENPRMRG